MNRADGFAAPYVLGVAALLLLLVGGFGLAEHLRAMQVKSRASLALTAALNSAARTAPFDRAEAERRFRAVLRANLGEAEFTYGFSAHPKGGANPASGAQDGRPFVTGRLEMEYRFAYLGQWLPGARMVLVQTAPINTERTWYACHLPVVPRSFFGQVTHHGGVENLNEGAATTSRTWQITWKSSLWRHQQALVQKS